MKKYSKALALFFVMFIGIVSCVKERLENADSSNPNIPKAGVLLSYTENETTLSREKGKSDLKVMSGMSINSEMREVKIYFDTKGENYYFKTTRLDGSKSKRKDFVEPEWRTIEETNAGRTTYNDLGAIISSVSKTKHGGHGLGYMVTPYAERAKKMKEMIQGLSAKTGGYLIETQADTTVVKVTRVFEPGNEEDEGLVGYTSVSYLNVQYGVSVISELYDPNGKLTSKTTMLYKLIDDIPVVAYEEAISYSVNYLGETIEHRTITNYDNINITTF